MAASIRGAAIFFAQMPVSKAHRLRAAVHRTISFFRAEDGGVIVDWLVVTAGAVSITLGTMAVITASATDQADRLSNHLKDKPIGEGK